MNRKMLDPIDRNDSKALAEYLAGRSQEMTPEILNTAMEIIGRVRSEGDAALHAYSQAFDPVDPDVFAVSEAEIEAQAAKADPAFVTALQEAAENIKYFHEAQKQSGYRLEKADGIYLGQRVIPLDSVGIYVPGGRAQYPSSVLMNAIPAKTAGVKRIVMVTPPSKDGLLAPNLAAAAKIAGVSEIYKVGGAQAIAALAYGTESIAPVDKIVGPGNIYVAAAKKLVYGKTDIDMIAGPSEILVIADENANPAWVAADLISQAEHDPMASSILLSTSASLIDAVNEELARQSAALPKQEIIEASLAHYGKSVLCDSFEQCAEISNAIAPEHLELQIENPMALLDSIRHAGSVFLGYYACESVGDYFGGTNHVLPTSGTARFSSALGVDAFIKKSSYLHYSKEALEKHGRKIEVLAAQEDLDGHKNAVTIRIGSRQEQKDSAGEQYGR